MKSHPHLPSISRFLPAGHRIGPSLVGGTIRTVALLLVLAAGTASTSAQPVTIRAAGMLGSAGDDRIEGVAFGPDGAIYLAGWFDKAPELSDEVEVTSVGTPVDTDRYGQAFVARLNESGHRIDRMLILGKGMGHFTTVAVNERGVYLGGYAVPAAETVIAPLNGLIARADEAPDFALRAPQPHWTDPRIAKRNQRRGRPILLRVDHDLTALEAGTFLEGWQSVWHVPRPLGEDRWQPTGIGLLADGDVVVSHDGGYSLDPDAGEQRGAEHFYNVPDHISRLDGDLKERRWTRKIYTPTVEPEKVSRYVQPDWPHEHLGNTRTLRLRVDADGQRFFIAGWSPTHTSNEPWWSPFVFGYDGDGERFLRIYNPDPMSGGGDRMDGLVADTAIRSINVAANGDLLVAPISDGGNTVLRKQPTDYTRDTPFDPNAWGFRGRTLFWGAAVRVDRETLEATGGAGILGRHNNVVAAAWPIDLAEIGDQQTLVIGRHTRGFGFTDNAPHQHDGQGGFVRLYDADWQTRFSTSIPHADPATLAVHDDRAVLVGTARSDQTPTHGTNTSHAGGDDGYWMVIDLSAEDAASSP